MGFFKLFITREFWKIILQGIGFYILLFIIVIIGLNIYTQHGRSFPVPDFKGLTQERVVEIAKSRNLDIQVIDSTFIPYLKKGAVIEQYPHPGVRVKKHRTIFLTINAFNQAKVKMPNVVGVSYRQAKATLESRGLKVGRLIYEPDFAKNNVLKQMHMGKEIEAGTMIEKGQHIDLALGNGLARSSYPVPNLIKTTYNSAVNNINDSYFNIGVVTFDTTVHNYIDTMNAMVWKQRPDFTKVSRMVMGSKIDIWLTLNPEKFETDSTQTEQAQ